MDGVGDVGLRDGEVLEHAGEAPKVHHVGDECPLGRGGLRLRVSWRGHWFTVGHGRMLKKLLGVLSLREEEDGGVAMNADPEEMMNHPMSLTVKTSCRRWTMCRRSEVIDTDRIMSST